MLFHFHCCFNELNPRHTYHPISSRFLLIECPMVISCGSIFSEKFEFFISCLFASSLKRHNTPFFRFFGLNENIVIITGTFVKADFSFPMQSENKILLCCFDKLFLTFIQQYYGLRKRVVIWENDFPVLHFLSVFRAVSKHLHKIVYIVPLYSSKYPTWYPTYPTTHDDMDEL